MKTWALEWGWGKQSIYNYGKNTDHERNLRKTKNWVGPSDCWKTQLIQLDYTL